MAKNVTLSQVVQNRIQQRCEGNFIFFNNIEHYYSFEIFTVSDWLTANSKFVISTQ